MGSDLIFGSLAAAGLLLATIVHGLTLLPISFDINHKLPLIWVLHAGIFVVGAALVNSTMKQFESWYTPKEFLSIFPSWAKAICIIAWGYTLLNFVIFLLFIASMQGSSPEVVNGRFVLVAHGEVLRVLTEQEYYQMRNNILRGFSGHWMFFYLLPTLYFLFRLKPSAPSNAHSP